MEFLSKIYDVLSSFSNWYWGIPILIILVGGGIALTVLIGGIQFTRFGYIMRHTFFSLFDREEQRRKKERGISPAQAVTAALGTTIGTGNIVGAASAVAVGGPGALFWMWVCGFVAMAIKYSEVTLSVKYRQRNENGDDWLAGAFMYIKEGLHCKPLAFVFGILFLVGQSIIGAVHSSAISSSTGSVGISSVITGVVVTVIVAVIMLGGLKRLCQVTDIMVPAMTVFYLICALIVIGANIGNAGTVFVSIFKGAFTGTAAVGGFGGALIAATIRQGLSRGVFSNDAGIGLQAILHAQAEDIEHPAQQGMWAVFETFIDTIIVCSLTGFAVLFTGAWQDGTTGELLASSAFSTVLGPIGRYGCVLAIVLFALSSLIGMGEVIKVQSLEMFGNVNFSRVMQVVFVGFVLAGSLSNISSVFMIADLGNALVLTVNIVAMLLLGKELRQLSQEWFGTRK